MKERLDMKDTLYISVMLFGLFFGAGNLIFPVYLGYMAGSGVWSAAAGFLVTGVGLPLLGVAALGVSRSSGLLELSGHVGEKYGYFFTCALYLTIGRTRALFHSRSFRSASSPRSSPSPSIREKSSHGSARC